MKNLVDHIKVYENVIIESVCDEIKEKFIKADKKEQASSDYYKYTELILFTDSDCALIEEDVSRKINEYVEKFFLDTKTFLIPEILGYERMRVKHYPDQGGYDLHCDVVNHLSAKRMCACFVFLSSGGEISFPELEYTFEPKKGSLMIFPATWMMPYYIKPEFYAIETYLHYK